MPLLEYGQFAHWLLVTRHELPYWGALLTGVIKTTIIVQDEIAVLIEFLIALHDDWAAVIVRFVLLNLFALIELQLVRLVVDYLLEVFDLLDEIVLLWFELV